MLRQAYPTYTSTCHLYYIACLCWWVLMWYVLPPRPLHSYGHGGLPDEVWKSTQSYVARGQRKRDRAAAAPRGFEDKHNSYHGMVHTTHAHAHTRTHTHTHAHTGKHAHEDT